MAKLLSPKQSSTSASSSATPTPSVTATAIHTAAVQYPSAIALHPGYAIGGYYLNGSENADVAVLSIPTFEPEEEDPEYPAKPSHEFQQVAREFISKAASDGKTKMVIDLRGNGGGNTFLGFDLFKLFFPEMTPYQATRRRAHEAFKELVDLATYELDIALAANQSSEEYGDAAASLREFYYRYFFVTPNDTDFESADDFYGPRMVGNDSFTSLRG